MKIPLRLLFQCYRGRWIIPFMNLVAFVITGKGSLKTMILKPVKNAHAEQRNVICSIKLLVNYTYCILVGSTRLPLKKFCLWSCLPVKKFTQTRLPSVRLREVLGPSTLSVILVKGCPLKRGNFKWKNNGQSSCHRKLSVIEGCPHKDCPLNGGLLY